MSGIIYVGSPYWHENPAVRVWRQLANCRVVAALQRRPAAQFHAYYSPLAYTIGIAPLISNSEADQEAWRRHGIQMLAPCSQLIVLKLPGWDRSTGLEAEIDFARRNGIEVSYLDPQDLVDSSTDEGVEWLSGFYADMPEH